jgi:hypothetical protein
MITEYQPEKWTMLKDHIYAAQQAIRDGIDYTQELLANRDCELGRDHRSNRETAERIEREIEQMKLALANLSNPHSDF